MRPYFALVSNLMQYKYQQVCRIILYIDLYLWECAYVHTPSHLPNFEERQTLGCFPLANVLTFDRIAFYWIITLQQFGQRKKPPTGRFKHWVDETSSSGAFELSRLVWLTPIIFWRVPLSCDVQRCVSHLTLPQQRRAHKWCQGRVSDGSKGAVAPAKWAAGLLLVPLPCCVPCRYFLLDRVEPKPAASSLSWI